ncbi:MAG: ABC transporter substrate-binding protein [Clostridia bacterium]|nr:ABC transporter substrate-binding protein [Clostridia bacterium]
MKRLTAAMLMLCLLLCDIPLSFASNVDNYLTVGIQSTKTTLIKPLEPKERDIMSVYGLVYESLVTIDDNYLPQPYLASGWEESNNGKTWTFTLRENVFFSDGTPLTANDVVATAEYIIARATEENSTDKGYYVNLPYFISSITAEGTNKVVVKAKRRYYGLLYAMTFPVLPADRVAAENPPGTGPYTISMFDPGNLILLDANKLWWQQQPQVQEIRFDCFSTPKEVMESYEYARVDTIFTRDLAAAQHKSGTNSITIDTRTNQLETLVMNFSSSPLDDPNIRKAIRYIVDPDKLAAQAYNGMVQRTDTPMIPGTWLYNDNLTGYFKRDEAEARRLLEESGWTDTDGDGVLDKPKADGSGLYRMHIRIFYYEEPDNDVRASAANAIADMLTPFGFECAVVALNMNDMKEKLKAGAYDLALVSYAMDVCPDPTFLVYKSNTGNFMRYNSGEMNDLCDRLREQSTQAGYQEYVYKIQEKFAQDCPFICLYYRQGAVLTRKMYTTVRDIRELELMRGIETFHN